MSNGNRRTTFRSDFQCGLNHTLGFRIKSTGSLVEQQDLGIRDNSPSNSNTLLLTTTEQETALTDIGLVPLGKRADKVVGVSFLCRFIDQLLLPLLRLILPLGANKTVSDILEDSGTEECWFLGHERDLATEHRRFRVEMSTSSR